MTVTNVGGVIAALFLLAAATAAMLVLAWCERRD